MVIKIKNKTQKTYLTCNYDCLPSSKQQLSPTHCNLE